MNNEYDDEIPKDKVLGKVVFHSAFWGKFIIVYLKYVFACFTVIIIFINMYWSFREREKNGKEKKLQNKTG